jgi:hypothetical protein
VTNYANFNSALKGLGNLGDLDAGGKIILKCVLQKQRVWLFGQDWSGSRKNLVWALVDAFCSCFANESKNQGHEGFRASLVPRGSARRIPLICNCHWPRLCELERPPYNKRTWYSISGGVLCLKKRQVNVLYLGCLI